MSAFPTFSGWWEGVKKRFHPKASPPTWWEDFFGASPTASGVRVTDETALRLVAVFSAIRFLSETVASLPLITYRRLPNGGKERAPEHPIFPLLHHQPNPEMTAFELRETIIIHLNLRGNAFMEIQRNQGGRIIALWPLHPDRMRLVRKDNKLFYLYQRPDGGSSLFFKEEILHHKIFSRDGLWGMSPIDNARQAIGLGIATEEFGARYFGGAASPRGVLEYPGKLSDKASLNLRESFEKAQRGLKNAHRLAILEEGLKWKQIGLAPEESQFLETRKFQVTEIARIFRVPPHVLADLERATFSNVEQQGIDLVVYTITPWAVRLEQGYAMKLFSESERRTFFAEHLVDGLLRGDIESRFKSYQIARQSGWMTANEIREKENMNPLPGEEGNIILVPLNMVPASTLTADDSSDPDEENRSRNGNENRAREAEGRHRIEKRFRPLFSEVAGRIIRRERSDVLKGAKRHLSTRDRASFDKFLTDFYSNHVGFVRDRMRPVVQGLAESIAEAAAQEINAESPIVGTLSAFVSDYTDSYAQRHVDSSLGQINSILDKAEEEGADPLGAIEDRLDEWIEKRPEKIASIETVRTGSAVAKNTWIGAGVSRLKWVTFGDNCPYCDRLNGRTVSIKGTFVGRGDTISPPGVAPFKSAISVGHPPVHQGCDCSIVPA